MKLISITRILGKLDQIPAKHSLGNFSRLPEWNLHKKTVDAVLFLDPPFNTTARDCPQEWRNRKEKSLILQYEKRGLLRPLLPIIPFFCDSSLLSRRSLIRVELKIKKRKKRKNGLVRNSRTCGARGGYWSISGRPTAIYVSFCTPTIKRSVNRLA